MSNSTTAPLWPMQNSPPIIWSSEDRSFILSAFFYGYVILQVWQAGIWFNSGATMYRFQVGGWQRCTELRRCLDTGIFKNTPLSSDPQTQSSTTTTTRLDPWPICWSLSWPLTSAYWTPWPFTSACWWLPSLDFWHPLLLTQTITSFLPSSLLR